MTPLSDTPPEVERLLAEAYRRMPAGRKGQLVAEQNRFARALHAAGHRMRNPAATPADVGREWAALTLGPGPWLDRMDFATMSPAPDHVRPLRHLTTVLDDLNIRYAVGGSFASSLHGYPRQTHDADLTVEPFPGQERLFALRFPADEYYADEAMARDAVARRSRFNLLHLPTGFKIDLFVRKGRPFDRELLARRVEAPVFGEGEGEFGVVTAEEVILLKLEWFRLGGETSDRQWNDVLGVLRVQADRLDAAYLDRWAAEIGVKDRLDQVRGQA
ncbi:MAG: hypothetical protein K2X87_18395 [Gemmataceae bacterium]|nr:hypothetical protein [Gemmataceae bacterium]